MSENIDHKGQFKPRLSSYFWSDSLSANTDDGSRRYTERGAEQWLKATLANLNADADAWLGIETDNGLKSLLLLLKISVDIAIQECDRGDLFRLAQRMLKLGGLVELLNTREELLDSLARREQWENVGKLGPETRKQKAKRAGGLLHGYAVDYFKENLSSTNAEAISALREHPLTKVREMTEELADSTLQRKIAGAKQKALRSTRK